MSIVLDGTTGITTPAETVSGNLGIGTGSPSVKLDISGTTQNLLKFTTTNTEANINFNISGSTGNFFGVTGGANFFWYTGSSERMRLDSSGNLGLGVTPSAWGSFKAIQSSYYSIWNHPSVNACYFGNNVYINSGGSATYVATAPASQYQLYNGTHQWSIAGSGTAGSAISFTQAMTLDASGNLGVGTTSPGYKLQVAGRISYNGAIGEGADITLSSSGTSIRLAESSTWTTLVMFTGGTERARIDSSGNLLVGATAVPSSTVSGSVIRNPAVGPCQFSVGTYTSAAAMIYFINGNGTVGSINTNGTATTYATSSDYRLKENVQPMVGALATVSQLKPCTYSWKSTGETTQGFIAHELQAIVPECVIGEKDAVDEDGNPKYQGIDTSFLVATLTAAIQEQQAIIQTLTSRIEALEGAAQ